MWQVSGRSDITDFEEVVRLDLGVLHMFYIGYQNVDTARVCMAESNDGIHNWVRSMDKCWRSI